MQLENNRENSKLLSFKCKVKELLGCNPENKATFRRNVRSSPWRTWSDILNTFKNLVRMLTGGDGAHFLWCEEHHSHVTVCSHVLKTYVRKFYRQILSWFLQHEHDVLLLSAE